MRRFGFRNRKKRSAGKVIAAALVGSAVGATVGLLMAPSSGKEMIRRIKGEAFGPDDAQERARTAARNVESQARELAGDATGAASRRRTTTPSTEELGL
ncbi:MAG TPA: YtxH domain-containing protein [Anaerolineales bacterium]|nr:YtxH domain-containing protein [Anaerolineales bacterium]